MTTPNVLQTEQWEIDGYVMGPDTSVNVGAFSIGGPDIATNDVLNPRADGERHGREYRSGRTIEFDLNALSDGYGVLDVLSALGSKWNAETKRLTPGAYSLLRYKLYNRTRRVWGTPRQMEPVTNLDYLGNVPITANFRTVDPYFYDDVEHSNNTSIAPVPAGGLIPPLSEPVSTLAISYAPGQVVVGGTEKTWLYFIIYGPITNPKIECLNEWALMLNMTIAAGEYVVIDPRPWSRGIRLNNVTPVGGLLSQDSQRIADLRLSPGSHEIILSGIDLSATASMLTAWRNAYSSY